MTTYQRESLTGRVFGELTVAAFIKHGLRWDHYRCVCYRGHVTLANSWMLKNGRVSRCAECEANPLKIIQTHHFDPSTTD